MKTYKQLMEVMSIDDMNKIKGGTDHQRKIAQDRQKRREAREKGFDPNKSVMADGSKPSEEKKAAPAPSSSAIVKADKPVAKGGAIEKAAPRKPDLRKSQLGKWSEGAKKSPGALAKKAASAVTKTDPVKKVDVKVDEPKKKPTPTPAPGNKRTPVPDRSYLPTGKRPEPETPAEKAKKKKNKKKKGDNLFTKLRKTVSNVDVNPDVSTYSGQQQQGLQQRGNQVSS